MFDHVALHVRDFAASGAFYSTVLATLGIREPTATEDWLLEWEDFDLSPVDDGHPEPTTGLHVAFAAPSREHVDAFHAAGVAHGAPDDGAPGERDYTPDYYGAFLRDPDGNSVEAVHLDDMNTLGHVDHLWIHVTDHDAAVAFYTQMSEFAAFEPETLVAGERTIFRGGPSRGSFSLVADGGPVTQHLHLAFPAPEQAVRDWHAAAVAAGHPDNGGPGERPEYHPGYYGAFVLDPDGNNLELVDHHRD